MEEDPEAAFLEFSTLLSGSLTAQAPLTGQWYCLDNAWVGLEDLVTFRVS